MLHQNDSIIRSIAQQGLFQMEIDAFESGETVVDEYADVGVIVQAFEWGTEYTLFDLEDEFDNFTTSDFGDAVLVLTNAVDIVF